jgi:hypothetical protein
MINMSDNQLDIFLKVERVYINCLFFVLKNKISIILQFAELLKFYFWKPKKTLFMYTISTLINSNVLIINTELF